VRLNADVQYVLGGLSVSDAGWSDTFVHRPLAYRGVLAAINALAGTAAPVADRPIAFETAVRGLGWVAALAAGVALWLGLRRHLGPIVAAGCGAAASLALMLAPQWDVLQGEWLAALLAIAGVGATLLPRRLVVGGVAGGLLLALAAGMKLATVFLVPAAVVGIALLDPGRARALLVGTAAWGVALIAVTLAHPTEWRWTVEMAALNAGTATSLAASVADASVGLVEKAIGSPVMLVAPAAAVMVVRLEPAARRRRVGLALVVIGVLALAPMLAQARWTPYHAAALPVGAAILVVGAGMSWWLRTGRPPWLLAVGIAAVSVASTLLLGSDRDVRLGWSAAARWVSVLVAVILALLASREPAEPEPNRSGRPAAMLLIGLAALLAFVPAAAPASAWSLAVRGSARTNASWTEASLQRRDEMRELSDAIGRDTLVLYLAYGDIPYHMGNPTACRYPSPLWLASGTSHTFVREMWSYEDNLRCIHDTSADRVVIQPGWVFGGSQTGDLRVALRRFDCEGPISAAGIRTCSRAASSTEP
jgi:hypothetical protein